MTGAVRFRPPACLAFTNKNNIFAGARLIPRVNMTQRGRTMKMRTTATRRRALRHGSTTSPISIRFAVKRAAGDCLRRRHERRQDSLARSRSAPCRVRWAHAQQIKPGSISLGAPLSPRRYRVHRRLRIHSSGGFDLEPAGIVEGAAPSRSQRHANDL